MRTLFIGAAGVIAVTCGLAIIGCSSKAPPAGANSAASGGSSGMVGAVTSVSDGTALGSLTPAESTELCNDTYAYFGRALNQASLCKWAGLTYGVSSSAPSDAMLEQNCASEEAMCQQAGAAAPSCTPIPAGCAATVAQYNACIADQVAALNSGIAALPACATVTLNDLANVYNLLTANPPASCASLISTCPTLDLPAPHEGTNSSSGSGGAGGSDSGGGAGGSSELPSGGSSAGGVSGGATNAGGAGGSVVSGGAGAGAGAGGAAIGGTLPGDVAKAAGTPFVAAHAMTRALFASYTGPLFKALRVSDQQEKDIGSVAATGLVDTAALNTFCTGTTCKVTTLYDQSGNGNDIWRADDATMNQPGTNRPCDLMDIQYWQRADATKVPIAVETGAMWKSKSQCLRNRDKTKNMPTGAKPQTEYAIFHKQYANNNCCFNYGNTGNAVHYSGPGTLSALNFSSMTFWTQGTGTGPWPMVDFETGVYTGNTAKCGSGVPSTVACTSTGSNPNPTVTFDIATILFKHNGTSHWALKSGNAKAGALSVNIDLASLPAGYSPLKQEGGLGLGEGGAGDPNGTGGFSEGGVIAGETSDATDDAIQKSIVSVYGK
jgi:hypothetical protein